MGFFDDVGKALGVSGNENQNRLTNQITPPDPRLAAIAKQQADQANAFQANLPSYITDQYSSASGQMKQQADQNKQDITGAANSRGLLYSGIHQGAQQANQGSLATALAQRRANIQSGAEQQAGQMQQQALSTSLGQLSNAEDTANMNYGAQMSGYQSKMKNIDQLQKGLGQITGSAGGTGGSMGGG